MKELDVIIESMLQPAQIDRWEGVQWLINDDPRGSGRTHLMALAFIQKALYAGYPIQVWDHHKPNASNPRCMHRLYAEIQKCIKIINTNFDYMQLVLHIRPTQNSIEVLIEHTVEPPMYNGAEYV